MFKLKQVIRLILAFLFVTTLFGAQTFTFASVPVVSAAASYNGQAAANWALNNVLSPSGNGYYDYTWRGGDCTNFVSHAIRNGGLSQAGAYNTSTSLKVWWQRDLNWWDANMARIPRNSNTWSHANELGQYLLNSGKASLVFTLYRMSISPAKFKIGDIVQISTTSSVKNAHHSMIVTKIDSSGAYITDRNANGVSPRKNAKLSEIVQRASNEYFLVIRIK
jgi:hypothetical protein